MEEVKPKKNVRVASVWTGTISSTDSYSFVPSSGTLIRIWRQRKKGSSSENLIIRFWQLAAWDFSYAITWKIVKTMLNLWLQLKYLDQGNLANAYIRFVSCVISTPRYDWPLPMQWDARGPEDVWKSVHLCYQSLALLFRHSVLTALAGNCIHLCICSHASAFHINHSENPSQLLAGRYGNWLGSLHFRSGGDAEYEHVICFPLPRWIFRELLLSMHALCFRVMVSILNLSPMFLTLYFQVHEDRAG